MSSSDEPKFDLPATTLKMDPALAASIEKSGVKKLIGPLIMKAHKTRAQKIALLSFGFAEEVTEVARLLAIAFAQQIDRRCAVVVTEGIRFQCENFDSYSLVTFPEIESPMPSERLGRFVDDVNRNFPAQIIAGPSITHWKETAQGRIKLVESSDAQILIVPHLGIARSQIAEVQLFAKQKKLNWLGMIAIDGLLTETKKGGAYA